MIKGEIVNLIWSSESNVAFEKAKEMLISNKVLTMYNLCIIV